MYAMARNTWKFAKRDARAVKEQHIEFDYLAPDTVEEMLSAMARLELLAARAAGSGAGLADAEPRRTGPRDPVRGPGRRAHAARSRRHETFRGT